VTRHGPVHIGDEVLDAVAHGRPVVALETAVLTHGLPRSPMQPPACAGELLGPIGHRWDGGSPANLELVRAMAAVVRGQGAVPATVGMIGGSLVIGLNEVQIARLGEELRVAKISSRDIAPSHVKGFHGGTTVAGTLHAIRLANRELERPIRTFATGGIGGVHRGWTSRPDISADLLALRDVPVCVVSAGAKSILDLPATLEALDTLGIPVLGLRTPWFPRFLTEGAPPLAVQEIVSSAAEAAAVCAAHWNRFGNHTGVLLGNPPPARFALRLDEVESIITESIAAAEEEGVTSAAVTPYLLARLADRTQGRTVEANIAALLSNAGLAALVSRTLLSECA
jgi:pseudouridine-5'-phosphate glycosidase